MSTVAFLLGICMAAFVYYDSGKREVSMGVRAAWTAATFFLGIIALIPYFIFGRKKKKEAPVLLEDGVIDVTEDAAVEAICPSCNEKVPVGSRYCLHCGKKQDEDQIKPAHEGICPWCKGSIPVGAEYCIHCGKKI
ncbi:MAG: zinc ribbon domain-containing protein [Selenomonadales bacterium]|nr:zinc ribbon domain-containing protein [Selenomonadales bacterium]